jgi:hypothetical protein
LFGGYQYSTRRVRSVERLTFGADAELVSGEQDNRLHSALAGLRLKPATNWSLNLDAEIGRADRPFLPISERNYHAFGARLQYRSRTLTAGAATRLNYNTNSVSFANHASRARRHSADFSWTPAARTSLDASYSNIRLDAASALAYFVAGRLDAGKQSLYRSDIHTLTWSVRFSPLPRLDLFAGYTGVRDRAGDGTFAGSDPRRTAALSPLDPAYPAFFAAQAFPLTYQTPLARASLRIHEKLRWNIGYQYYRYGETFGSRRDWRAHTGYTSLLWSF